MAVVIFFIQAHSEEMGSVEFKTTLYLPYPTMINFCNSLGHWKVAWLICLGTAICTYTYIYVRTHKHTLLSSHYAYHKWILHLQTYTTYFLLWEDISRLVIMKSRLPKKPFVIFTFIFSINIFLFPFHTFKVKI